MHLRILWLLVLTSLLVLLRPCDTQALSLGYTNGKSGTYSSAMHLLTVNSRQMLPGKQSDLVFPDYLQRSHIISVYEEKVAQSPDSSIFLRLLADQYLRRFRELADIDDVLRAEQAARRSLALQPRLLQNLAQKESNSGQNAVLARYLELTGNLASARQLLDEAMQEMDSFYTTSAETRAWFHVRTGDLAFAAGDFALSEQRYREALNLFPRHIAAFTGLARLYATQHRWQDALKSANQGIELMPLVETLSYKADAQLALGDQQGAAETEDLIGVVAYLSKVKGIYDRAMAVYYTEHGIHLPEALQIARSEVAVRDDIYAEDTLAWAAAANGQWEEAQRAAQRATRFGTEDALLQFHAGIIALHLDNRELAVKRLTQAVSLNPSLTLSEQAPLPGVKSSSRLDNVLTGRSNDLFTSLITQENHNFLTILIALAIAFLWGGLHALSPGHGKTIVGAYLVGSRSNAKHALFLGLIMTITHTAGIFALGLVTLGTSQFILTEELYPWLSVLSGLLVTVIGLNLFISRLQGTQVSHSHDHVHSHEHSHDLHHHQTLDDSLPLRYHHDHNHLYHKHSHLPPHSDVSSMKWSSLLALGISGGLLPCPSALVVLLSAIAMGRIGFGLALVSAFSLGLAAVLTGIGLILVYAKDRFEHLSFQIPRIKMLPVASALCITIIGLGITSQALLAHPWN